MKKHCLGALVALAVGFVGSTASAQYPGGLPPREHNGLYLRAAIGVGAMHDQFRLQGTGGAYVGDFNADSYGASGSFEAAIGGSLRPGLNLAAALFLESVQGSNVSAANLPNNLNLQFGTLVMFGPKIDWYPRSGRGWHLEAGIAASRLEMSDRSGYIQTKTAWGPGFEAGIGYEFYLGPKFGLGVLARFLGATMNDGDYNHTIETGSLLLTATYN
jgi:hypothetical protein